ncbi:ABC transporter ATP-binding protein [Clostridium tagluense]|uniref:ABC transporter ATP-binding protein n=1 Tax=Clostridium tagluense TaxID=360422 RepID=UPI001CF40663|nr:ABC transporter ATP-binding protein [Clostridium tagluense]MCB2309499.1 ABC transporter ATP-binding protein [Clostridium tagluense]MCB2314971.1 ABC transporter ATP-binding protein [Clostridium tagluense]MCB2319820.1 ABC transporter ATP-binding protein [Clostridium tagluense]MCB2324093.1 ABC transporter ATP-binding protein [Clostridium tagluense]MCB2328944.1 ABC transporter ATP-binding protein [Clostridium tagluense]
MLEVRGLKKTYVSKGGEYIALRDVDLKVKKGEFVAVMGPSGSGKTTLLNCISGFIHADSGKILLDGVNILNINEDTLADVRQNKLGFVFQDYMLVNGLTVLENIFLPQIIAGKDLKGMEKITENLMLNFGIETIKNKYPSEISGGQKQRVAIARALANKPLVLLADEPTGNLDSKSSEAVIEAFMDAKKNFGATVFMVTHDAFAASHCDRVIALADGQIVKELVRNTSSREFLYDILTFMKGINGDVYDA